MNTLKYEDRLPAVRVSQPILRALKARAREQGITLAEAHRQALAEGLRPKLIQFIPRKEAA
jgi:hypothetical protein